VGSLEAVVAVSFDLFIGLVAAVFVTDSFLVAVVEGLEEQF
jgi:hypothetical protein